MNQIEIVFDQAVVIIKTKIRLALKISRVRRHPVPIRAALIDTRAAKCIILIVANDFEGKKLTERHRMIYVALRGELKSNIHALAIKAMTEEEYKTLNPKS